MSNYHQLGGRFCKAANQFCPSITTLFQKSDVILSKPSDTEEAPIISGTLKIHKFTRCPPTTTGEFQINFSPYRITKNLVVPKSTPPKKRCGHEDAP